MKRYSAGVRLGFMILAALLALPLAQIASPVDAKKRPRTATRTFSNIAAITLPAASTSPVSADLYPSPIAVTGMRGSIRDVNVRLNTFTATYPHDLQVLLVGPGGKTAILMAYVGGGSDISDVTLTLDDEASPWTQGPLLPGAYRPANKGNELEFNDPAPAAGHNTALSVFDGSTPNGTWRLFVRDDYGPLDSGTFGGGWALEITAKVHGKKKR